MSVCELCWVNEGFITIPMAPLPDAQVCEYCEGDLEEVKKPAIQKIVNIIGWLSKKRNGV